MEQLVADIGGIVGLCIGGSFLSIIEVFELVYRLVFLAVKGSEGKETPVSESSQKIENNKKLERQLSKIKSFVVQHNQKVRQMDDETLTPVNI